MTAHLCGIISAAKRRINSVKPIVECSACVVSGPLAVIERLRPELTFNYVSYLQKCDWLRIRQAHRIFKVK